MREREAAIDFVCKARVFQRSNGGAAKVRGEPKRRKGKKSLDRQGIRS